MRADANIYQDLESILVTREEIQHAIRKMGETITRDYAGKEPVMIGILKGAVLFYADLIREIDLPLKTEFMAISSYGSATKTSGVVRILKDLDTELEGLNVLIVEDIIDSGLTLDWLQQNLVTRGAKSVKIATLLRKPDAAKVKVDVEYVGFDIPNEFVVGYGLDYAEDYRHLPFVGVLAPHVYGG